MRLDNLRKPLGKRQQSKCDTLVAKDSRQCPVKRIQSMQAPRCQCDTQREFFRRMFRKRLKNMQDSSDEEPFILYPSLISGLEQLWSPVLHTINQTTLSYTWLSLVPTRLGANELVSSAITAILYAQQYTLGQCRFERTVLLRSALESYQQAVRSLSTALRDPDPVENDAALACAALLALFESMVEGCSLIKMQAHWAGVSGVLLARRELIDGEPSEISRAIAHDLFCVSICVPLTTGMESSPLDTDYWLNAGFPTSGAVSEDISCLRQVSYRLFIRLPRAVARVKGLLQMQKMQQPTDLEGVESLLSELCSMEDRAAEDSMLHKVNIRQTRTEDNRAVVPYSFDYESIHDFAAMALYWAARLTVIKLITFVLDLSDFHTSLHHDRCALEDHMDQDEMNAELVRMSSNMLMSWQYAENQGPIGVLPFSHLLLPVWRVLKDVHSIRGTPKTKLRAWLLHRLINPVLCSSIQDAEQTMDYASDALTGGFAPFGRPDGTLRPGTWFEEHSAFH